MPVLGTALAAPSYQPDGPQTNVAAGVVAAGGWSVCFSGLYSSTTALSEVFATCNGDYLMYAGYDNNNPSTYIALAWGPRNIVLGGNSALQTFGSTQFYYR